MFLGPSNLDFYSKTWFEISQFYSENKEFPLIFFTVTCCNTYDNMKKKLSEWLKCSENSCFSADFKHDLKIRMYREISHFGGRGRILTEHITYYNLTVHNRILRNGKKR